MKYILTYHGHPVSKYDYYKVYAVDDYVIFDERLYRSLQNFNVKHIPDLMSSSFYWEEIGEVNDDKQEKEDKVTRICGNHIGNISGDNVVVYGHNTGNISANGAKSVVVVFGDIIGNITAEQVVRFDNLNLDWVKAAILEEKGKNNA